MGTLNNLGLIRRGDSEGNVAASASDADNGRGEPNGSRFWVWILASILLLGGFAIGWGNWWLEIGMLVAAIALWGGALGRYLRF